MGDTPASTDTLTRLSACDAARAIRDERLRAIDLVEASLARIDQREAAVQAWTFLDPELARAQASERDAQTASGQSTGPLHGVPVGIKDIVDTADMPTANGTPLCDGRQPRDDAVSVARLRAAGAVILGKTVTTELAVLSPGKTRNPHDPAHTPGGSSSGSAAAVADFMVPLSDGTQTNGSVIRPASFCGVVGFKPSWGRIPRTGMLPHSDFLVQPGVFARTVEDAALMASVVMGHDASDPSMRPFAVPDLAAAARSEPACRPRLAFVRTHVWDQAEAATQRAFEDLVAVMGGDIETAELPDEARHAHDWHGLIMDADLAVNLDPLYKRDPSLLSDGMRATLERGQRHLARDYLEALNAAQALRRAIAAFFERFDAILTPAAPGPAPEGLKATGNPAFCTAWTLLGLPAFSLPLLHGGKGLPVGVQLVGAYGEDAKLCKTAAWLCRHEAVIQGQSARSP